MIASLISPLISQKALDSSLKASMASDQVSFDVISRTWSRASYITSSTILPITSPTSGGSYVFSPDPHAYGSEAVYAECHVSLEAGVRRDDGRE